ncbi:hypothetical protein QBC40DRAFT_291950 [Triangularia verruculosa]|uniref:Uncharacterized protein n=1 Tax=Triangularia verruculosa TaxID=2587418 RepID=A0AAN6XU02_9PEZI|nr:hypothetical protein QBC40DRAFT_291950 [Triangularia verruculosa]
MNANEAAGRRLLGEIEETGLDEVLAAFRTGFVTNGNAAAAANIDHNDGNVNIAVKKEEDGKSRTGLTEYAPKTFPIEALNDLVQRNFRATGSAPLAISGRYYELIYVLIATLIASPWEKAVAVIDFEGRFDPLSVLAAPLAGGTTSSSQKTATKKARIRKADLDHVHVLQPRKGNWEHQPPARFVSACLATMEQHMLYGAHRSRGREWWGTVVIGGGYSPVGGLSKAVSAQVAVTAGRRGWLRVERAEVSGFGELTTVEQPSRDRDERQQTVEQIAWVGSSPWGGFSFGGETP